MRFCICVGGVYAVVGKQSEREELPFKSSVSETCLILPWQSFVQPGKGKLASNSLATRSCSIETARITTTANINLLYRRLRNGATLRELSRGNDERFLAPSYGCVPCADCLHRYNSMILPNGALTVVLVFVFSVCNLV